MEDRYDKRRQNEEQKAKYKEKKEDRYDKRLRNEEQKPKYKTN